VAAFAVKQESAPGPPLHSWDLTTQQGIELQAELARRIDFHCRLNPNSIRFVAAVDVSMNRFSNWLAAAAVVCDLETKQVIETSTCIRDLKFPYVPGLLSFRELPAVIDAIAVLKHPYGVIVVDGQGRAHPRRFGVASHLGLWLNRPTIGFAKSRLCGEFQLDRQYPGHSADLLDRGEIIGKVLQTRKRSHPVFVSAGHGCCLDDALALVRRMQDGRRIIWPIRAAHDAANHARTEHMQLISCQ
jgi:deoxyribonuclease V